MIKPPNKTTTTEPEQKPKESEKPDEDAVTSYSDYICEFRAPTKIDFASIMKPTSLVKKDTEKNLCGKKLASGKHCQNENVGGCANTGCTAHYGWQDEVEGFYLRTF